MQFHIYIRPVEAGFEVSSLSIACARVCGRTVEDAKDAARRAIYDQCVDLARRGRQPPDPYVFHEELASEDHPDGYYTTLSVGIEQLFRRPVAPGPHAHSPTHR